MGGFPLFFVILQFSFLFFISNKTEWTHLPLSLSPSPPLMCGTHILGHLKPLVWALAGGGIA
jgi:hypothetical protein